MRFFAIAMLVVVAASITLAELAPVWVWFPATLALSVAAGDISVCLDQWWLQRQESER